MRYKEVLVIVDWFFQIKIEQKEKERLVVAGVYKKRQKRGKFTKFTVFLREVKLR